MDTKEMMMKGDGMDSETKTDDAKNEDDPPTPQETKMLKKISKKKYAEGDVGKLEALRDLQAVFDELHEEKVFPQPVDVFASGETRVQPEPVPRPDKRLSAPLTPLIPLNLDKFKIKKKNQEEYFASISEQNLRKENYLKKEQTTSLPILQHDDHERNRRVLVTMPPTTTNLSSLELEAEAFQLVSRDLSLAMSWPSFPEEDKDEEDEEEEEEDGEGTATADRDDDSDTEKTDAEDILWKGDLNRLAQLRANKSKISQHTMMYDDRQTFQLKYKPPIWPHQLSLHQILSDLPALTCLVLDGSEIGCLRDLGSSLPSLFTLSVARCGLTSLDGTAAFPYLRTLIASNNELHSVIQASYLTELNHLDVSSNPIKSIDTFAHLVACTKLRSLKMYSTPIASSAEFHSKMKTYLPQLKQLYPLSGGSDYWSWTSSATMGSKKGGEEMRKEKDGGIFVQKIMQHEFDVIYQNNFQKKQAAPQESQVAEEEKVPDLVEETDDTDEDENLEDGIQDEMLHNFENPLRIKSIQISNIENVSTESFITEIEDQGGAAGDGVEWYSAENSDAEVGNNM